MPSVSQPLIPDEKGLTVQAKLFNQVQDLSVNPHIYLCLEPNGATSWMDALAQTYVGLRGGSVTPLNPVIFEGIQLLDVTALRKTLQRATLPIKRDSNFDVVRSDFGEMMSYLVLETWYLSQFGYKQVRDRETIQLPGRGIDAIGVEDDSGKLRLVLVETKVSDESTSPPQVVDAATDSLRAQHRAHLSNHSDTSRKIWDISRRALDEAVRNLLFAAALYFERKQWDKIAVVCCCFLVRSATTYQSSDFGSFRASSGDYAPAVVRFLVMRLPDSIKATVDAWYERAQQHVGQQP